MYVPPPFPLFEALGSLAGGGPNQRWLSGFFGPVTEPAESVSLGLRWSREALVVSTGSVATYGEPGDAVWWAVHLATQAAGLGTQASLAVMQDLPKEPLSEGFMWDRTFDWGGVRLWQANGDRHLLSVASRSGRLYGPTEVQVVDDWREYGIDGTIAHSLPAMSTYRREHGPRGGEFTLLPVD